MLKFKAYSNTGKEIVEALECFLLSQDLTGELKFKVNEYLTSNVNNKNCVYLRFNKKSVNIKLEIIEVDDLFFESTLTVIFISGNKFIESLEKDKILEFKKGLMFETEVKVLVNNGQDIIDILSKIEKHFEEN